jgi:hypothetical protein
VNGERIADAVVLGAIAVFMVLLQSQ